MSFTTPEFLCFLALLAALYRVCPPRRRWLFLLVASYIFYCLNSVAAAGILLLTTVIAYAAGLLVRRNRSNSAARVAVLAVVVLFVCYLLSFKLLAVVPWQRPGSLFVPLGISYYTFKLISYVLDVYWDKMPAETSLVRFASYVAFFPQIVAGPIQRADDYLSQEARPQSVFPAIARIAQGLAKKLLIADQLAPAVNYVFAHTGTLHGAPLWLGFYLWPLQLYADFSGLTDIAIGSGLLFGIRGPENFNRPFTATSISDYWRRWHMSLTGWLRDYLFTPVLLSTRNWGQAGLAFSLAINMMAIAFWHGIAWTYCVFGLLHSAFLIADALTLKKRKLWFKRHQEWDSAGNRLGWLLTFHQVVFALAFFRAATVHDGLIMLSGMFSFHAFTADVPLLGTALHALAIGAAGYLILEICERFRLGEWCRQIPSMPRAVRWSFYSSATVVLAIGFLLLLAAGGGARNPFVYAVF